MAGTNKVIIQLRYMGLTSMINQNCNPDGELYAVCSDVNVVTFCRSSVEDSGFEEYVHRHRGFWGHAFNDKFHNAMCESVWRCFTRDQ